MAQVVLHFDINGTITAVDSTEVGTDAENTNMTLARSAYGKVVDGKWTINTDYNEVTDSISYYDYLKSVDKTNYKKRSFTFTDKGQPGESLKELFQTVYA